MSIRAIGILAVMLAAASPATSSAQEASAPDSPVRITDPFVIPWHHDTVLACMTFTNSSDRVIDAVRFGLRRVQDNPLGSEPDDGFVDRIGSFAPGVAIRPPTKFLGTVNSASPALANCWQSFATNIKTELRITVLKVVYHDGSVWTNPAPEPLASITY
jgi:hypothetical protein